jgi:hypothetical protein
MRNKRDLKLKKKENKNLRRRSQRKKLKKKRIGVGKVYCNFLFNSSITV